LQHALSKNGPGRTQRGEPNRETEALGASELRNAFFKANPKFAQKIKIVDEKAPHLIDLLDAVKI
jgi:hypothetical protein